MPWNDNRKPVDKPGPWDPPTETGAARPGEPRATRASEQPHPPAPPRTPSPPWSGRRPDPSDPAPPSARRPPTRPPVPGPPARGPDLDELRRRLHDRVARAALAPAGRRLRWATAAAVAGALAAGWLASGVYDVPAGEVAAVSRFGALTGVSGPGLHYHWPAPLEGAHRLSLETVNRSDLGSGDPDDAGARLLTRDGDLLGVAYTAEWRVADPRRYLFSLANPQDAIRVAAAAAVRQAVAATPTGELLGPGRDSVAARALPVLQAGLDRAGVGVQAVAIRLRGVEPPGAAAGPLRDLGAAQAEADEARRDAEIYRVRVLADARADAAKAVQASQGYRDQEVSEAKGEAARFALVDAEYRKAPEVTRDRLYTETMQRVLHDAAKVVVQLPRSATAQVTLPPEAIRRRPEAPPAPSSAPPAAATGAPGAP